MPSGPAVTYRICPAAPHAHRFTVQCEVASPTSGGQVFELPNWLRGSYLIRDFAKHVSRHRATNANGDVTLERTGKSTLACAATDGPLTLRYEVHAFDASVRKAYLDHRRGFFNGSSVFYAAVGATDRPARVVIERPPGDAGANWSVHTTLPAESVDAQGFGSYLAADYDALIDHPVELADAHRVQFAVDGIDHEMALTGAEVVDDERLTNDLTRICAAQRALFGGEPSLSRYLFLTNVIAGGYGGIEHCDSCALICSPGDLPHPKRPAGDAYRGFLGLCSHEYFHQWNVKRITPTAFAESALQCEAYTRDLWHYEGVTSYYDDYFLRRAGILDDAQFLDVIAANATRVERTPGRHVHSLAEASFEAWTKFYQADENTPNATVSYYVKGALAALCVDLTLRRDAVTSLDAVMRTLWERHGRSGTPVPEGGLEQVIRELAGPATPPLEAWIRGRDDLPLTELLASFGVVAERRVARGTDDRGGAGDGEAMRGFLGARLKPGSNSVVTVRRDSPAERAGLSGNDQIVAIDGQRAGASAQRQLDQAVAGERLRLHVFRAETLIEMEVEAAQPVTDTWSLRLDPAADEAVCERRRRWLAGEAP